MQATLVKTQLCDIWFKKGKRKNMWDSIKFAYAAV